MIFFFYGPNSFALHEQVRAMEAQYIKKAGSDFGLTRFDGSEVDAGTVISTLESSPFLANSRLVIINNLLANRAVAEKVVAAIDGVPDSTVAVFVEREVDKRTTMFKTLAATAKTVVFDALEPVKLTAWLRKEIQRQGGEADRAAMNELIGRVGDDQWQLAQEAQKLVNYNPKITRQSVELLVTKSGSESIFDLVDAIAAGQTRNALTLYHNLLSERVSEVYILTMIIWQLRNLLLAKTAGAMTGPELAKAAGMSPFVASKMLGRRGQYSEEQLKRAFTQAVECEYAIKSGQGDGQQLVEQLIVRVSEKA